MSTFQRYKVCTNRSSDGRVMTPGSRGVGAVFACFSGEDSGQMGEAIGKPRVARRSWSRHLSNTPGLAGQLAASRKDSARECGYFGIFGKLALPSFSRFWVRGKPSLGSRDMVSRTGPPECFWSLGGHFSGSKIPARPGKILAIREFHTVHECVLFPTYPGLRINSLRVGKTLRASVALRRGELGFARYDLANRGHWSVPYAKVSFSGRDSGLTRGALDDPEVARCS
uniref:Uncharacterized protein n=1 Tax=Fagus sylvatica TaxID=28930 RepID=A0A2N9G867_FAGSY